MRKFLQLVSIWMLGVFSIIFILSLVTSCGSQMNFTLQDWNFGDEEGVTAQNRNMSELKKTDIQILNMGFKRGQELVAEQKDEILRGIKDLPLGKDFKNRCEALAEFNIQDPQHAEFFRLNKRIMTTKPMMQWIAAITWGIRSNIRYYTGLRTEAEQREKVEKGLSKTMDSLHLKGMASDCFVCGKTCKTADWENDLQYGMALGVFASVTTLVREKTGCKIYADNSPDWKSLHDPGHHGLYDRPRYERDKDATRQMPGV